MILFEVWTPAALATAVFGGIGAGFVLGRALPRNDVYTSRLRQVLTGIMALWFLGGVFYMGQIAESLVGGDPNWTRILSRFGLWLVYAVLMAVVGALSQSRRTLH